MPTRGYYKEKIYKQKTKHQLFYWRNNTNFLNFNIILRGGTKRFPEKYNPDNSSSLYKFIEKGNGEEGETINKRKKLLCRLVITW